MCVANTHASVPSMQTVRLIFLLSPGELEYMFTPQLYRFRKEPVPENPEEKLKMVECLMKFGVSITQYEKAYNMPDITM